MGKEEKPEVIATRINPAIVRREEIRTALIEIADGNDGYLSPHAVVQAASNPESVLHDEFEWNNDAAGERFRLLQAAALIRRVRVTVVRKQLENKSVKIETVREYQSRPSARNPEQGYEHVQEIMQDSEKRAEMLRHCLTELAAIRRRYQQLTELAEVWSAIDAAKK